MTTLQRGPVSLELSAQEKQEYRDHKAFIKEHRETWVEVTLRVMEIHERRLYRAEFKTFEDFCSVVLGKSARRIGQMMQAARQLQSSDGLSEGTVVPTERKLRTIRQLEAKRRKAPDQPHVAPKLLQLEPLPEPDNKYRDMSQSKMVAHLETVTQEIVQALRSQKWGRMKELTAEGLSILGNLQRVLNLMSRS